MPPPQRIREHLLRIDLAFCGESGDPIPGETVRQHPLQVTAHPGAPSNGVFPVGLVPTGDGGVRTTPTCVKDTAKLCGSTDLDH